MQSRYLLVSLLVAAASASAGAAGPHASPAKACMPIASNAHIRMTPMMPMGAGYFALRNPCGSDVVLTGVSTARFRSASMHQTRIDGGISRMLPLERVSIRPGETIDFSPGGRHLMLMSPDASVRTGEKVRLVLQFANGARLPVDFDVQGAAP